MRRAAFGVGNGDDLLHIGRETFEAWGYFNGIPCRLSALQAGTVGIGRRRLIGACGLGLLWRFGLLENRTVGIVAGLRTFVGTGRIAFVEGWAAAVVGRVRFLMEHRAVRIAGLVLRAGICAAVAASGGGVVCVVFAMQHRLLALDVVFVGEMDARGRLRLRTG